MEINKWVFYMLVRVRIDYSEIYLKTLFILIDLEEGWDEGTGSL